jgi:hypothetical protein
MIALIISRLVCGTKIKLSATISDPHWSQCGSGSYNLSLCGSDLAPDLDFAITREVNILQFVFLFFLINKYYLPNQSKIYSPPLERLV